MRPVPRHVITRDLPQIAEEQAQRGMWFLPSHNRPDRAQACMEACAEAGQETPGLLIQDGCHYSFARAVPKILSKLYPGLPRGWSAIQTPERRELAGALTYAGAVFPSLDWYGVISDGVRPLSQGWDRRLLAACAGKNFVSCSDSGWRDDTRMAGILVVPGWIIRAMGYWFPPGMKHLWTDDCWEQIAGALGNWVYAEDVRCVDNHFSHPNPSHRVIFDTPRELNGQPYGENDRRLFEQWRSGPEFTACVNRIKDAWGHLTGEPWALAA